MNTAYGNMANYSVAESSPEVRAAFIRKTYAHLAGAILLFVLLEGFLFTSGASAVIAQTMLGGRYSWAIVLVAFMGVSWLASWWANSQASKAMQYLGLGLYVIAEAIIFVPLLYIAKQAAGGGVILEAGIITLCLFGGLTAVVFLTRKDFSFLGPILAIGGFVALGFIFTSIFLGFNLGNIFALVMVVFAGGAILYDTSNVLHRYNPNQHVAAALSLFASVALMFWYVLRIFSSSRN